MKTIVIGVIGTRRRDSVVDKGETFLALYKLTSTLVEKHNEKIEFVVCSGGCPKGGDRFAEIFAKNWGLKTIIYKADWGKHGKAAGFIRNTDIAKDSDYLIACVAKDRKGGTEDTIKKFKKFHPENLDKTLILVEEI